MPKGTPRTTIASGGTEVIKLTIPLRPADYNALAALAGEQYRTPELQAAWLIARILNDAGRTTPPNGNTAGASAPIAHAERILNRARTRAGSDEAE